MTRAQGKCSETTVTMAYKVWNEITWMNEWIWDEANLVPSAFPLKLVREKPWERGWDEASVLAGKVWNGVSWMDE